MSLLNINTLSSLDRYSFSQDLSYPFQESDVDPIIPLPELFPEYMPVQIPTCHTQSYIPISQPTWPMPRYDVPSIITTNISSSSASHLESTSSSQSLGAPIQRHFSSDEDPEFGIPDFNPDEIPDLNLNDSRTLPDRAMEEDNHKSIEHADDLQFSFPKEIRRSYKKICKDNSKSVSSLSKLTSKPYEKQGAKCDQCNTSFLNKFSLIRHVNIFHDKQMLKCIQCDKLCLNKPSLTRHIKTVHDKQVFNCDKCDKLCLTKPILTRHIKTVHNKQVFNCDKCDKLYLDKKSLTRHIKTDHYKQAFNCNKCDESYPYKSSLITHVKSAHYKQVFDCDQCDKSYPYKSSLRKHVKSAHEK